MQSMGVGVKPWLMVKVGRINKRRNRCGVELLRQRALAKQDLWTGEPLQGQELAECTAILAEQKAREVPVSQTQTA